jgi:endo-1,4-beta-xylanase
MYKSLFTGRGQSFAAAAPVSDWKQTKQREMNCWRLAKRIVARTFAAALLIGAGQAHAQTVCADSTGTARVDSTHGNSANWYTFWSNQSGNCGANQLTLNGNGQYQVKWGLASNSNMVAGLGWQTGALNRSVSYNFGTFNPGSNSYLALYGWSSNGTVDWYDGGRPHHVEYYVLHSWGGYNPGTDPSTIKVNNGNPVNIDGVYYYMYLTYKYGPSYYASGSEWFYQFWLIRQSPLRAPTGTQTINFGNVVSAWARYGGMHLNSADGYQVIATEGYGSSGSSGGTVWKNN